MYNFNVLAGYSPEFLRKTKEIFLHLARERYPRVTLDEVCTVFKRFHDILIIIAAVIRKHF